MNSDEMEDRSGQPMDQELKKLLELQELDLRIIELDDEKNSSFGELKELNERYEEAAAEFEKGKEKYKRLQIEIKKVDMDLESGLEKIKKFESQQSLVKTNQEYKALDKEIIDARARVAIFEEKMLEKMEENEQTTALNKQQARKVEKQQGLIAEKEEEIKHKIADIELQIEQVHQQRESLSGKIEKKLVRTYTRIFKNKKGTAIVPIFNQTCQGCHLTVPPNVEAQARRHEELILCENCGRILYFDDAEEEKKEQ